MNAEQLNSILKGEEIENTPPQNPATTNGSDINAQLLNRVLDMVQVKKETPPDPTPAPTPAPKKRGRGRPKGSKNKAHTTNTAVGNLTKEEVERMVEERIKELQRPSEPVPMETDYEEYEEYEDGEPPQMYEPFEYYDHDWNDGRDFETPPPPYHYPVEYQSNYAPPPEPLQPMVLFRPRVERTHQQPMQISERNMGNPQEPHEPQILSTSMLAQQLFR